MVESLKASSRAQAEAEVRNAVLAEVGTRLTARLDSIGETTLGLDKFLELWKTSEGAMADAEEFIFGNTPMCEALRKVRGRFESERASSSSDELAVFLLVSDGESTDGNPTTVAADLVQLGVTVIGCYITDRDVIEPRVLASQPLSGWPKGAKDMFRMSSIVDDDSELARHLLREGWRIPKGARAFVQANHSDLLEELVAMALSPMELGKQMLPKGT